MKKILLLDDDEYVLAFLTRNLLEWGYHPFAASNVGVATEIIQGGIAQSEHIDFAIVDLFLLGARGDHLSNGFITEVLLPANVPYGRLTSAPDLVPSELMGEFVFDKRQLENDANSLKLMLLSILDAD